MLKVLLLILVLVIPAFAQTTAKPTSYLFGEAKISKKTELIEVSRRVKKQLHDNARNKNPEALYVIFYHKEPDASLLSKAEKIVRDTLFANCRDCFGYDSPRITFVVVPDSTEQRVQFWFVPPGAEDPITEIKKVSLSTSYPILRFAPTDAADAAKHPRHHSDRALKADLLMALRGDTGAVPRVCSASTTVELIRILNSNYQLRRHKWR